jgi:quercetin dioxygenase-like cupin family protein
MAKSGDELIHPVTGERLVWRRVSRDTSGELVEGDLFASPGGHPAAAHVHPNQQERFGVLSGTIKLRVDGQESTLGVGEWAEVPVGRPHTWWNDGQEDAQVLVQVSPALRTEMFFETFFGLAKDGKTNSKGLPNLLSIAGPPAAVQTVVFTPLSLLGRAVGYRGWYPKYSADPLQRFPRHSAPG